MRTSPAKVTSLLLFVLITACADSHFFADNDEATSPQEKCIAENYNPDVPGTPFLCARRPPTATPTPVPTPIFGAILSDSTGTKPSDIAWGYFNNSDNFIDVNIINYDPSVPAVPATQTNLISFGDFTFAPPDTNAYMAMRPVSNTVANYDGDAHHDIAQLSYHYNVDPPPVPNPPINGVPYIQFGLGDGVNYDRKYFFNQPVAKGQTIETVELNGDGRPDLAYTGDRNTSPPTHLVPRRVATLCNITRNPAVAISSVREVTIKPYVMTTGDFNEDTKKDLIIASPDGGFQILLGNGDCTLQAPIQFTSNPTLDIRTVDMNHDGHLDLISAEGPNFRIYFGAGNATFPTIVTYDMTQNVYVTYASQVVGGPFNRDTFNDVCIIADDPVGLYKCMTGDGTGNLFDEFNYTLIDRPHVFSKSFQAVPINADSTLDLTYVEREKATIYLMPNQL